MTEDQAKYTPEDKQEVKDAVEMLGSGYAEPAFEIELPREVVVRRGEKLHVEERPAFIKISTAFKDSGELAKIDEVALKVWLYLALSINKKTGKAHPGLRTIAKGTRLAVNTVRSAVARLEGYGLMIVYRNERHYNIYEPTNYVSAKKESVSSADTVSNPSVSTEHESVSVEGESVSARVILNQSNQKNQNKPAKNPKAETLQEAICSGQPVTETMLGNDETQFKADAQDAAHLIAQGQNADLYSNALIFMRDSGILPTLTKLDLGKWRKAFREMADNRPNSVTPEHITQAIVSHRNAVNKDGESLTFESPHSIKKGAKSIANQPKTLTDDHPEHQRYSPPKRNHVPNPDPKPEILRRQT